jgi:hypothetical protein
MPPEEDPTTGTSLREVGVDSGDKVGISVVVVAFRVEVVVGVGACVGTGVMVGTCRIEAVVGVSANVGIGVMTKVSGERLSGITWQFPKTRPTGNNNQSNHFLLTFDAPFLTSRQEGG